MCVMCVCVRACMHACVHACGVCVEGSVTPQERLQYRLAVMDGILRK